MRKGFLFFVLLFLYANSFSQIMPSLGTNTKIINPLNQSLQNNYSPLSWQSRAFGYNTATVGYLPKGPVKFFLNTPGTITSLAADTLANFLCAGSFDEVGNYWGIRYGTYELYKLDTSSGYLSLVGVISGGTAFTGMSWDPVTGNMYALSSDASTIQLGILNTTTAVWTPIGTPVSSFIIIDIAISNTGQVYGHRLRIPMNSQSEIVKIDKNTNAITVIGFTGFAAWYSQGMSWDRMADSCYLSSYNYSVSRSELRRVDILSGGTYLIGVLTGYGSQIDAFAIRDNYPQITHQPLTNTEQINGIRIVNCSITPAGFGINPSMTKLYYSKNNLVFTDSLQLTNLGGNNWAANLTLNGAGLYRYYLKTRDSLNRLALAPGGAPINYYTFTAGTDTIKPVITHTPIINTPKSIWPVVVNAIVTDNIGIDSVWVKWYKNAPTNIKQFRLNNSGGNNYSALFNSTQSEVNVNDSIHYRIFAKDNSSNHNMDSTLLYSFRITSDCVLGNDTIHSNYPFTTYWEDGRTNILILNSEISSCYYPWGYITKIGFNFISADPAPLNGFNIKMQNTNATTITAFTNYGWTVCYNGTYTIPGPGWQYITLTSSFYLTPPQQNLIIEICYNNSSWTQYSPVYSSPATGKMVGYSTDLPSGDGCTAAWTATSFSYRPNISITLEPFILNVGNTGIPEKFSLSQNYPNPFNPFTKIDYSIPKNGFVSLKIFDILGREIKTLVNEKKDAGYYSVDFNGSDFSSGIYFYTITSREFTDTKKMLLIK